MNPYRQMKLRIECSCLLYLTLFLCLLFLFMWSGLTIYFNYSLHPSPHSTTRAAIETKFSTRKTVILVYTRKNHDPLSHLCRFLTDKYFTAGALNESLLIYRDYKDYSHELKEMEVGPWVPCIVYRKNGRWFVLPNLHELIANGGLERVLKEISK